MQDIELGDGLVVSAQGFGAMGMSAYYGDSDEAESIATLNAALDAGVTFLDTAEAYGPFANEELIGRALAHRRDEFVLATKFAREFRDDGTATGRVNGTPAYARTAVERSLRHLRSDVIDVLYLHRVDPDVPVEETVGGMADLVHEGKVRHLGLSEVGPQTLRRALTVHPIAAVQSELSLFSPGPVLDGTLAGFAALGVGFVAFSPLGRGMLSGAMTGLSDLAPDDARRTLPRFQPEAVAANLALVDRVREVAARLGATPAQVALAWVSHVGAVPIPGTRRRERLAENVAAADVRLDPADLDLLATATAGVVGDRDTADGLAYSTS